MAESIVKEIHVKSILVPSRLPEADYVLNSYVALIGFDVFDILGA